MSNLDKITSKIVHGMDTIAQWTLVALMGLTVVNIVLRVLRHPLIGTYEFVSFLAAVAISFTLACCALHRGHIAVTILVNRLSPRSRAVIEILAGTVSLVFFLFSAWYVAQYATDMVVSGEVSPTTRTPFYPFIYGVALSFVALCLVLFTDLVHSFKKVISG